MYLMSYLYIRLIFLVTRWKNAWGRTTHHTVTGSSQTYLINLTLPSYDNTGPDTLPREGSGSPKASQPLTVGGTEWYPDRHQPLSAFCTCAAFAYTIMLAPGGPRSTPIMVIPL